MQLVELVKQSRSRNGFSISMSLTNLAWFRANVVSLGQIPEPGIPTSATNAAQSGKFYQICAAIWNRGKVEECAAIWHRGKVE